MLNIVSFRCPGRSQPLDMESVIHSRKILKQTEFFDSDLDDDFCHAGDHVDSWLQEKNTTPFISGGRYEH